MSTRFLIRDNRNIFTGFNGASNLDITKSNPTGLDFGATTDFSVSVWMRTQQRIAGRVALGRRDGTGAANVGWIIGPSGNGRLFFEISDGTTEASPSTTTGPIVIDSLWHLCVCTFDRDGLGRTYVDGVAGATVSIASVGDISTAATANLRAGRDGGGNNRFQGELGTMRVWSGKILTATEILDFYQRGVVPQASSQVLIWSADNMAGLTAYDSSGQGNDGTIVSGIYAQHGGPFFPRGVAGGNMLYNGDFEHAPAVATATTTDARWIDGSAGGSTNTNGFGWAVVNAGTCEASFATDVYYSGSRSLRLSTKAVASNSLASIVRSPTTAANIVAQAIPVLPSTSYTVTYRMKTNYVSGDSNDGATLRLQEYTGAGASVTSTDGTKVKTTTDWTYYTFSITTGATTRFLRVEPRVVGNSGTATLIMDAWYDEITLNLTTPTVRSTPSIQRMRVRDFGTALKFTQGSGNVVTIANASELQLATGFTVSAWAYLNTRSGDSFKGIVSKGGTANGGERNYLLALNNGNTLLSSGYEIVGGANKFATGSSLIPLMRWFHAIVTWDGNNVQCYQNGISDGSAFASTGTPCITTADVEIGRNQPITTQEWDGMIDEVRIWNRALSATEVSRLYYDGYAPSYGLVGEWMFDEGSGSEAIDSSEYGNNGVITGSVYSGNVRMISRTTV